MLGRAVAAHTPGVQATLSSDLRWCYAQPRSAAQRPDKHPNTFDEQGPVLERLRDQNPIGMNQKPVPNFPGGRLGEFRIRCSSIRIRVRGPNAIQNQPLLIKGVGVLVWPLIFEITGVYRQCLGGLFATMTSGCQADPKTSPHICTLFVLFSLLVLFCSLASSAAHVVSRIMSRFCSRWAFTQRQQC